LKVTAPSALALPKVYHVEVARSDLPLLCARACVRACVRARASGKIGEFFWKNKIELHSGLQIKCSKYPPLFRKHNRNLLSKFYNTDLSISRIIPSQILFILFIMSNLVVGAFS